MSQLGYRLNQMVNIHHKESSYSTRNSRGNILNLAAKELLEGGFKLRDPSGLKCKLETPPLAWGRRSLTNPYETFFYFTLNKKQTQPTTALPPPFPALAFHRRLVVLYLRDL